MKRVVIIVASLAFIGLEVSRQQAVGIIISNGGVWLYMKHKQQTCLTSNQLDIDTTADRKTSKQHVFVVFMMLVIFGCALIDIQRQLDIQALGWFSKIYVY
jgi:hypothetical protein